MFKIGISGHINLKKDKIKFYEKLIRDYLLDKKRIYNDKLVLITPLAEGADAITAKIAYELGIKYEALFPLPTKLYVMNFNFSYRKDFDELVSKASKVSSLDEMDIKDESVEKSYTKYYAYHYDLLGKNLVNNCDEILILWDGIYNAKIGGTSEVVKYLKECNKKAFFILCEREINKRKE